MNSYLDSCVEVRLKKSYAFWHEMLPYLGVLETIKLQLLSQHFYRFTVTISPVKIKLPCLAQVYLSCDHCEEGFF